MLKVLMLCFAGYAAPRMIAAGPSTNPRFSSVFPRSGSASGASGSIGGMGATDLDLDLNLDLDLEARAVGLGEGRKKPAGASGGGGGGGNSGKGGVRGKGLQSVLVPVIPEAEVGLELAVRGIISADLEGGDGEDASYCDTPLMNQEPPHNGDMALSKELVVQEFGGSSSNSSSSDDSNCDDNDNDNDIAGGCKYK
jgi:hypothetical protein